MSLHNLIFAEASILPHVNASLNALAAILLVTGIMLIKAKKETPHKLAMLSAFVVSVAFLTCYLIYHATNLSTPFPRAEYPGMAIFYYALLLSHVLLAMTVPVLAVITIYLGWKDRRAAHKKLAKWTFPIWLYVSVTGVAIYFMLYWLFLPKV